MIRTNKAILLLICALVMLSNTGCKRTGGDDGRVSYDKNEDRSYTSRDYETPSDSTDGVVHVVSAGQSLLSLKEIYGISIQAIKKYNPSVSENKPLVKNQRVFIPGSSSVLLSRREAYFNAQKPGAKKTKESAAQAEKLEWPVEGKVISKFSPASKGIYIKITPGVPVKSVGAGEVVYSGKMKGYGNLIIVDHLNAMFSIYGLNSKNLVKKGDAVKNSQKIAVGGDKSVDNAGKIYFELRNINAKTGEPESVDPLLHLKAVRN